MAAMSPQQWAAVVASALLAAAAVYFGFRKDPRWKTDPWTLLLASMLMWFLIFAMLLGIATGLMAE